MMKKDEVQVGRTYMAKVGTRHVEVRIEGETPKGGWNAKSVASGKPIRIKDPKHLRPVSAANDAEAAGGTEADVAQPAPPDDTDLVPLTQLDKEKKRGANKGKTPKAAKAPKVAKVKSPKPAKEKPAREKTPKAPKAMSALDAAAAVLKGKGSRCGART